jgi:cytochrome b561
VGLVAVQFFLAGLGTFRHNPRPSEKIIDSTLFDPHRVLGDVLVLLALAVMILGFVTRRQRELGGALFGLMILQVVLAAAGAGTPVFGALHALNAVAVLAVGAVLLMRTRPATRSGSPAV